MSIPFQQPTIAPHSLRYLEAALTGQQSAGGTFGHACESWLATYFKRPTMLVGSATAALDMAAQLAGISTGDEVIMPAFTHPSTANAVAKRGATPVFVDISPTDFNIDPNLVCHAISPRTRALIAVHYAGVSCDMPALQALCRRHNLWLIEDAAQAFMARYRQQPLGQYGDFAALSFHASKNIGCGEGGALIIKNTTHWNAAEQLRDMGTNRAAFMRGEVAHYQWMGDGASLGLSEIQAALLLAQLEQADNFTQQRLESWHYYHQRLAAAEAAGRLTRPSIPQDCQHNGHIYPILLADRQQRDAAQQYLKQDAISALSHFEPLHLAPAGQQAGRGSPPLHVTEALAGRLLRLPLWNTIKHYQQDRVIASLLGWLEH